MGSPLTPPPPEIVSLSVFVGLRRQRLRKKDFSRRREENHGLAPRYFPLRFGFAGLALGEKAISSFPSLESLLDAFSPFSFLGPTGRERRTPPTQENEILIDLFYMDDSSSEQTQTTTQDAQRLTNQPVVENPPVQEQTTETRTNPVSSETPTPPNSLTSPSPEPQPVETSQSAQPETPAPSENESQSEQTPVTPLAETQPSVTPSVINIPALHYPFSGNIPVTFSSGAQSDNEKIKKKFQEWGIIGHNGLDFGLTSGTEVFPCDSGKVIQSGDNGDFGTSIIIQHSWGQSLYAHLSESKVKIDDEIQPNKVIGLSGSSGAAFGEHLHFAIKPNTPDSGNGYLGFIDPAPYLSLSSQKEETPPVEEQKLPEQPPQETKPPETPQQPTQEQPKSEEVPPINYGSEKPVEPTENSQQPEQSQIPQNPQTPQPSDEEIQKQVDEKLKVELDVRRQKANQARQTKREEHLMKIEKLIKEKKQINNQDVCDLLHVSQSTATNYLTDLVKRGTIKLNGKGKAITYSY